MVQAAAQEQPGCADLQIVAVPAAVGGGKSGVLLDRPLVWRETDVPVRPIDLDGTEPRFECGDQAPKRSGDLGVVLLLVRLEPCPVIVISELIEKVDEVGAAMKLSAEATERCWLLMPEAGHATSVESAMSFSSTVSTRTAPYGRPRR